MSQQVESGAGVVASDVVRLSVNLHRGTSDVLQQLARNQKLTLTEIIRRAISLYKFVIDEQQEGRKIVSLDADGNKRELVLM